MLKRYKITQLFLGQPEHIKKIEKSAWYAQIQAAMQGPKSKITQEVMRKLRKERETGD